MYELVAREVQIETNGDDPALTSAAGVNAAVMLEQAVRGIPALADRDRVGALTLPEAYASTNAMGSYLTLQDPALKVAIDDFIAKDARMKAICGAG
ncbi:hypothetical protein [Mycobacterium spongiae]|uniref:hypothetical protein n=1 Tax=Mycobacterium spongiae TaxID=886343 RepID=UPI001FEB6C48|nr:hypothetical protein [Mycobacterium spongiae]